MSVGQIFGRSFFENHAHVHCKLNTSVSTSNSVCICFVLYVLLSYDHVSMNMRLMSGNPQLQILDTTCYFCPDAKYVVSLTVHPKIQSQPMCTRHISF